MDSSPVLRETSARTRGFRTTNVRRGDGSPGKIYPKSGGPEGENGHLVLRLIRSDWLVVEHATRISDGEAPVDFDFGPIRPPVPGAGAAAQFSQRRHPLAPQALPRPQAGFQFGRIKPTAHAWACSAT